MSGQLVGYARVSTAEQDTAGQVDRLEAAGCARVFLERASGARADRPQLAEALAYLRSDDTLVIVRLDRLARSVRHLVELGEQLARRRINLLVLDQAIDTRTPAGRFTFHVLAAVAELERDLNRERTRDGLAAARARGRTGGRKPALSARQAAAVRRDYEAGASPTVLARDYKVGRSTIYRALGLKSEPARAEES